MSDIKKQLICLPEVLKEIADQTDDETCREAAKLASLIMAEYARLQEADIESKISLQKMRDGFEWSLRKEQTMRDELWLEVEDDLANRMKASE